MPKGRYENDASFRMLVDTMVAHMEHCYYTPSEMREAAVLASILYDTHHIRVMPILLTPGVEKQVKELEDSIRILNETIS